MRVGWTTRSLPCRAVAVATCMAVLCSGAGGPAWGNPEKSSPSAPITSSGNPDLALPPIESFHVPEAFGSVRERFQGTSGKLVIHLQDIHADYEAQANCSRILEFLFGSMLKGRKKLIAAEGAIGAVDVSAFQMCSDKGVLGEVADYFLKQALVNGNEYYAIVQDPKTQIQGLEDKDLYFKALEKFMTSVIVFRRLRPSLQAFDRVLEVLQGKVFGKALADLMSVSGRYKKGEAKITDYVAALDAAAKAAGISMASYGQIGLVLKTMETDKGMDFKSIDLERKALLDTLQKRMVKEELAELVKQSLFFRTGRISSAVFYGYVKNMALAKGMAISTYPNFFQYVQTVLLQDQMDVKLVLAQCEELEDAICAVLARSADEKELIKVIKQTRLLENLLKLELTRDQLRNYQENKEQLDVAGLVGFVRRLLGQHGICESTGTWTVRVADASGDSGSNRVAQITDADLKVVGSISNQLGPMEEFYRITLERDRVLVANTLAAMEHGDSKVIVQNTGGFHTQGILQQLKARNISYVVVAPRVTKVPDDAVYFDRMMDLQFPFEKFLAAQRTHLQVLSVWSQLGNAPIVMRDVDGREIAINPADMRDSAKALIVLTAIVAALQAGKTVGQIQGMLKARQLRIVKAPDQCVVRLGEGEKVLEVTVGPKASAIAGIAYEMALKQPWFITKVAQARVAKASSSAPSAPLEPLEEIKGLLRSRGPYDQTLVEALIGAFKRAPTFTPQQRTELWLALQEAIGDKPLTESLEDEGKRVVIGLFVTEVGMDSFPDETFRPRDRSVPVREDAKVHEREYARGREMENVWEDFRAARDSYYGNREKEIEPSPTPSHWAAYIRTKQVLARLQHQRLDQRDIGAKIEKNIKNGDYVVMITRPGTAGSADEIGIKDLNTILGERATTEIMRMTHDVLAKEMKKLGFTVTEVFDDYKSDVFAMKIPEALSREEVANRLNAAIARANALMVVYLQSMVAGNPAQAALNAKWKGTGFGLYAGISERVGPSRQKVQCVAQASSAAAMAQMGEKPVVVFTQESMDEKLQQARRLYAQLRGTEFMRFGGEYATTAVGFQYDRTSQRLGSVQAVELPFNWGWVEDNLPVHPLTYQKDAILERIRNYLNAHEGMFPDAPTLEGLLREGGLDTARAVGTRERIFRAMAMASGPTIPAYLSKTTTENARNWVEYTSQERKELLAEVDNDPEKYTSLIDAIEKAVKQTLQNDDHGYESFVAEAGLSRAPPNLQRLVRQAYFMRLARHVGQIAGVNDFIQQGISPRQMRRKARKINKAMDDLTLIEHPVGWHALGELCSEEQLFFEVGSILDTDVKNPHLTAKERFLVRLEKLIVRSVERREDPPILIAFDVKGMGPMNRELGERNIQWLGASPDSFKDQNRAERKRTIERLAAAGELEPYEERALLHSSPNPQQQYELFTMIILEKAGNAVTRRLRANERKMARIFQRRLVVAKRLGLISAEEAKELNKENFLGYVGGDELMIARSKRFMDIVNNWAVVNHERLQISEWGDVLLVIQEITSTRAVRVPAAANPYTMMVGKEGPTINFKAFEHLDTGTRHCKALEKFGILGYTFAEMDASGALHWNLKCKYEGQEYVQSNVEDLVENLEILKNHNIRATAFPEMDAAGKIRWNLRVNYLEQVYTVGNVDALVTALKNRTFADLMDDVIVHFRMQSMSLGEQASYNKDGLKISLAGSPAEQPIPPVSTRVGEHIADEVFATSATAQDA